MRRRTLLVSGASFAVAGAGAVAGTARSGSAPVVLELFTSQGCSDCPAADALMGIWAKRPEVIGLAWHVDYWDGAAWRDPFSSRLSTDRQRAYAQQLGAEVFTPALVVNGATMLVGSNRTGVEQAMADSRGLAVAMRVDGRSVRVGAAPGPVTLLFAAFDPEHETPVRGGENSGRRLREFQVVRESRVLATWDGGERSVDLPAPAAGQGAVVILQGADLRILGAARAG